MIDRPAQIVFDYLADMSNNPTWQKGQQHCEWTSEPPLRLGSTYDQQAKFLGKEITSSFEVIEFEPGEKVRIKSTAGTMPIDVTRSVAAIGDEQCELSAIVRGDPPRLFRLLGPLLDRLVRKSVEGDYARLKTLLEA